MGDDFIIKTLLKYSRQESLDGKEYSLLERWRERWGEGRPLTDLIHDQKWLCVCLYRQRGLPGRSDWRAQKRLIAATGDPLPAARLGTRLTTGIVSAAALIVVAVTMYSIHPSRLEPPATLPNLLTNPDSLPSDQARLICEDGKPIPIGSLANNGIIVKEGNILVRQLDKHTLQYELLRPNKPTIPIVHFFYAGMTGPYKLLFPDGSWVQLEKGASLRFSPTLRTVQPVVLNGEAWFSIAKNSAGPLSVMANGTIINVLGTEFHVSSMAGDKVTEVYVFRGAVKVEQGAKSVTLKDSDEVTVQKNMLLPKKKISDFDTLLNGQPLIEGIAPH